MAFLMILLACSLLIADAVQPNPYMSSFGKFGLKTNEEKRDYDDVKCREECKCPTWSLQDTDQENVVNGAVSKRRGKNANLAYGKRNDETAPFREGSVYGPWQRDDFNYPSAAVRELFH